jgi:outer membrane protein assembly factor BamA
MTHKISRKRLPSIAPLVAVFLVIIAFVVAVAQQPARRIAKIEFEGLQRLTPAEAIATSGLKAGEPFSVAALDAAGERLANSGLFGKVGYRTRTNGNLVTIVFQVEETKGGSSPVVFDNFVWFTKDELHEAIKRALPSFNGTATDAGNMTDTIKTALQNLLKERKIPGTVDYAPYTSNNKQEHLFSVTGVPIPICALHFPGAKNVAEEKLVKSSKELTDVDYSQKSAIAFGGFILYPIYREVGQLKAKFDQPIAKLENTAACSNGVDLSIPVEEGPIYLWAKPEWSGNEALSADDLNSALGMTNGEVANGKKLDKGMIKVQTAYGRKGHLQARVGAEPVFDDAGSRVSYKLTVAEGPQYKMGTLIIKGLSGDDTKALEEVWKLKYGAVLDTGYLETFFNIDGRDVLQKIFLARLGKEQPRIEHKFEPKLQTLTADVILEFKY